jgi:hypothetical protein
MSRYSTSDDDHQPMVWLRGHPFYAAHLLVLVFVVSLFATTLVMFFNGLSVLDLLVFNRDRVLRGEVWRIFTYGFVNQPSLWFALEMILLAWFGGEVEKFFGRRKFLFLYGGLYFLSPLLFTLIGRWLPMPLAGESCAFALFIAFATLYPDVVVIGSLNLLAKWVAAILVGLYTLMALAYHDLAALISLWATVGLAFAFVRYEQGRFTLPSIGRPRISLFQKKPKLCVLPDLEPQKNFRAKPPKEFPIGEIDALLDKIAESGMSSLTSKERARLDAAREELLKKGR